MTINLLSCVNYYVEDMVTFNAMANFYSIEYYVANVAELGGVKFFVQQKCSSIYTIHLSIDTHNDIQPLCGSALCTLFLLYAWNSPPPQPPRLNFGTCIGR